MADLNPDPDRGPWWRSQGMFVLSLRMATAAALVTLWYQMKWLT